MSELVIDRRTDAEKHQTAKFGMWMFLASEIMFFTGFIGSYIVLRIANPEVMAAMNRSSQLNKWIGVLNTFILIVSSLTMALSIRALMHKNFKVTRILLALTFCFGLAFLVIKILCEWVPKFGHHVYPDTSIFYSCYFLTTGFHGIHVLAGMIMFVCLLATTDEYLSKHFAMVENTGLYWHFVDIVWIFLFPMYYLMP
jgi:cytochrome c oxidase subunit 3